MKRFRLSLAAKMSMGFGMLTLVCILSAWLIYSALSRVKELNREIMSVDMPSVTYLEDMYNMIADSRMLLKNWVYVESEVITPDKLKLMEILEIQYPYVQKNILGVYHNWPENEQKIFNDLQITISDSLFIIHKEITKVLNNTQAYQNKAQVDLYKALLSQNGVLYSQSDMVLSKLSLLLERHRERMQIAQSNMDSSFVHVRRLINMSSIILIFLAIAITFITLRSLIGPINYIKKILISMGKGILPNERIREGHDEVGEISAALNALVRGLKGISNFAMEIGKGNYNSDFKPLSDEDILGNSLIMMREELRSAAVEDAKRKKEDDQRNWATQGVAKFSEILRQNNNNMADLSYNVISNLVNYLGCNQGGLFIVNDSELKEITLELSASYAYDRKKFLEKIFKSGEGLVGRCYLEQQTIYLTDIPKDYIKITSGIGEDNPTSLLIVPLLYNEAIYGVIEIASFEPIENFQIEFVERIASSIASTISAVKINIQTARLLEQSRRQAEEMAAQEEEMRQNMEELRATQEESARKEESIQRELKDLKKKKAS